MNNDIRRSKIYSYFYGRNTVFQQFLIVVGVLCILMQGVANMAHMVKSEKLWDKYEECNSKSNELESEYSELYYQYKYDFDMWYEEEVTAEKGDRYYEEKVALNEALDAWKKAEAKAEKAYDKFNSYSDSDPFMVEVFMFFGICSILAGAIWFIIKKITFNKDGEEIVDEELQIKIEEAKVRGLEKLNIIAEQIERVEPVVLNGITYADGDAAEIKSKGGLVAGVQSLLRSVLSLDKLIIGLIGSFIFFIIANALASAGLSMFLEFVLFAAVVGYIGYIIYKKFELDSYVRPKTIKRLKDFTPHLITRLGSDDKLRVSLPSITVYMFGDDQLYVYYQHIDLVTGIVFADGVDEYFYEDIVGIRSSQSIKKTYKRYGFLNLFIKTIDYLKESISIVTSGCKHTESYVVDMGGSLLDTKFVGMRSLIRQKKNEK